MTAIMDRALVDGAWVDSLDRREIPVVDPATDQVVANVAYGTGPDVDRAVHAAHTALPHWRARTAAERAGLIRSFFDLMVKECDDLAWLLTREQGKPLSEARGEVLYAAGFLEWSAEEAKRIYGEIVPASSPDRRIQVLRQPVGVAAAITPWNFPAAMVTRKVGPALAAGCTVVVRPSSKTPLTALYLGDLAMRAGIPPGVINVVPGEAAGMADALLADPRVAKVSFTGSTDVGKDLVRGSATNLTRLSLELGGHAPFIVFEDADLHLAVSGVIASKFRNGGQTCICANRIYVHDRIADPFAQMLAHEVGSLRVGSGLSEGVRIGPMIDDQAIEKIERHVNDAVDRGARIRAGGTRMTPPGSGLADRFYAPTIIEDVDDGMLISREETFGPVAPLMRFSSEAEVMARANDTRYGLAAYFFTQDASRTVRVAEALEYGVIGVNDGAPSTPQAPFGGYKESGLGREGGKWGVEEYLEIKYVSVGVSPAPV